MAHQTTDKNGHNVQVGDNIRVLLIEPSVIDKLNSKEQEDIKSMLGEVFKVEEVDEYGSAWVSKWWDRGNNESESHSLGLSSLEMELVNEEQNT